MDYHFARESSASAMRRRDTVRILQSWVRLLLGQEAGLRSACCSAWELTVFVPISLEQLEVRPMLRVHPHPRALSFEESLPPALPSCSPVRQMEVITCPAESESSASTR